MKPFVFKTQSARLVPAAGAVGIPKSKYFYVYKVYKLLFQFYQQACILAVGGAEKRLIVDEDSNTGWVANKFSI